VNSVFEAFAASAAAWPRHEFLHVPASASRTYAERALTYTYADALSRIEALRERYRASGLGKGARVALLLENRPAYFFHWFALNALGVSVVPINPDYRRSEIEYLLTHSEAILAVVVRERLSAVQAAAGSIPVIAEDAVEQDLQVFGQPGAGGPNGRDSECAVLYTSGTTGRPKGCVLSNDYFLRAGMRYMNRGGYVKIRPGAARVLTPLPMFHMNAMGGSTMGMAMSGGCVIQLDRFHPKTWWADVAGTRATGIHYLGVMPAILLGLPPGPEERAHCVEYGSGANVEPAHHAAFEARFGFPLIEGWAMTETGSSGAISADREPRHVGTRCFGRLPETVELRLVDEAGNDVPKGEPGEMLVRRAGPEPRLGFFSGYLKDPEATAEGWRGGWWHTGDIARYGPDGSLHFVDRRKNVIRRSGENISALEVETLLLRHPQVAQAAVAAVPDEMRGDEVFACIVPHDAASGTAETAQAITDWAMQQAAYYKAPGWIAFVDALPLTATQKLQRGELRALIESVRTAAFDLRSLKKRTKEAA
jgi:acyl-CoA synthetase (AMP-forming)/AMP-acid ligase II